MFSCEICEISKSNFFTEHLRVTASASELGIIGDTEYFNTTNEKNLHPLKEHPRTLQKMTLKVLIILIFF